MREFLLRRLGPLPIWSWFLILVFGGAVLITWVKKRKSGSGSGGLNSDASTAPNLTSQQAGMYSYPSDIFVNIQQPVGQSTTPGTPGPDRDHDTPPILNVPGPEAPPRTRSISYAVVSGDTLEKIGRQFGVPTNVIYAANQSTIESWARSHGFSSSDSGHWIWPTEPLMIPVS